jgi:hypothetical protein
MSYFHLINEDEEPKQNIYVDDINLEGNIENAKIKVQNGDIVDLSSLPDYGLPSYRLTSNGNGSVSWVAGSGTSGIEYDGGQPVQLGKLAKYNASDGSLVNETSFIDTDILLKDGSVAMTNNFNMNNQQIELVSSIKTLTIEPNPALDPNNINIQSNGVNFNAEFVNCNGQPLKEVEWRFTRQGVNYGNFGTEPNVFFFGNFNNASVNTEIRGANNEKLVIDDSTGFPECRLENLNLDMTNKSIIDVANLETNNSVRTNIINANSGNPISLNPASGFNVEVNSNLNMNFNDITEVNNIETLNISSSGLNITINDILDINGNNIINVSNINSSGSNITINDNLEVSNNDIVNIRSMTITATKYISRIEDLGTPSGNYYVIPDNTTYIILGQITLTYGIEFGINCSLRGVDFSSQIIFDETNNDCDIKAVDNNFYLSQLTIVNGGGRFTNNTALVRGLLNAQNYNLGASAPFYARNKRFKVTDVNILRPFKIGTIEGFGTLNITNNFFNGGGGLAGQATSYYTNEGISISDGLSLEFNNNKVVLMLGAQQASTLKMLNMKARVSPLLQFNAVTITGNIFHPRNSETGIDFDADSRTSLGNISGNVFIRTGGTSPLINYTDQTIYDNYNPLSIENYSINANTGVTNSEPNLKSAIGLSNGVTSINPTRSEATPTNNAQIIQINSSSRFAVQLDLTGIIVAFVPNERITDTASGNTALIIAVDAQVGTTQTIYITDMNGTFSSTPSTFNSNTGSAGGGSLRFKYRYSEKDPRKLVTNATFTISTGNNEQYFVAPGNGTADEDCEVSGIANNTGVGGTVSLSCTRVFSEGDIIDFFLSSAGGSSTSFEKGIINIK